jgi:catechol 2,3-dioxygenase-like lactoylglutathione lyase family enzyme
MTIRRMDHVGIVVDDLATATAFFVELGLEVQGDGAVEGPLVDRIIGLHGVRSEIVFLQTPDGQSRLELSKFHSPPMAAGGTEAPANAAGLRHVSFEVDDVDATLDRLRSLGTELVGELVRYDDLYRLCYVRGPEGILVELAERIG